MEDVATKAQDGAENVSPINSYEIADRRAESFRSVFDERLGAYLDATKPSQRVEVFNRLKAMSAAAVREGHIATMRAHDRIDSLTKACQRYSDALDEANTGHAATMQALEVLRKELDLAWGELDKRPKLEPGSVVLSAEDAATLIGDAAAINGDLTSAMLHSVGRRPTLREVAEYLRSDLLYPAYAEMIAEREAATPKTDRELRDEMTGVEPEVEVTGAAAPEWPANEDTGD